MMCMLTLSPEKLPSPTSKLGKCLKVATWDQKIIPVVFDQLC